jgi:hypothetical protein
LVLAAQELQQVLQMVLREAALFLVLLPQLVAGMAVVQVLAVLVVLAVVVVEMDQGQRVVQAQVDKVLLAARV